MRIIGDVHGKVEEYGCLIRASTKSVQLGDFGFKTEHDWHIDNVNSTTHKILFGNHDYIPYRNCKTHSLGDYGMYENMFYIAGAESLDKNLRVDGRDWFYDEELSISQGEAALVLYDKTRPSIMLSHTAPDEILTAKKYHLIKSRTAQILNACLDIHRPDIWVFGHMHEYIELNLKGVYFIGLDELQTIEL